MMLLTEDIKRKLPPLHSQDGKPPTEIKMIVKFFDPVGNWSWLAYEGEPTPEGDWEFFGLVDGFEKELGYFTLSELQHAKDHLRGMKALPIERDRYFGFDHTLAEVMGETHVSRHEK